MIEDIRKLRENRPFVPFTIHMADGRKFDVKTVDHFLVVGTRGVILNDDESIEILPGYQMNGITTHVSALPGELA